VVGGIETGVLRVEAAGIEGGFAEGFDMPTA
jgi:hypothetical protein